MEIVNSVDKHVAEPQLGDTFYQPSLSIYYVYVSINGISRFVSLCGKEHANVISTISQSYIQKYVREGKLIHYTQDMYSLELKRK